MRQIVRRWVTRISVEDGGVWAVETLSRTYRAVYECHGYPTRWRTVGGRALSVRPLSRKDGVCALGKVAVSPVDMSVTLSWLGGSQIV
jgi:hypothetical protein